MNIFSIPDAAVATVFRAALEKRFCALYSSHSYAYRSDRSPQSAIANLAEQVAGRSRLFIAELDFEGFFDNIDHQHLAQCLEPGGRFPCSPAERHVLLAALKFKHAPQDSAWPPPDSARTLNTRGIAQGHTLSLILANVAAHDLDKSLEAAGVAFFLFADDLVILSSSYEATLGAADRVYAFCKRAGLKINRAKSPGIRLLTDLPRAELASTNRVEFLSYAISADSVRPTRAMVRRIKRKLATIMYAHLISYPRRGFVSSRRLDPSVLDWDLVTCVNRIRRYVYGRLDEVTLSAGMTHCRPRGRRRGLVSYFPVVNRIDEWKELDGWLVNALVRAHRMRAKLLAKHGLVLQAVTAEQLLQGSWMPEGGRAQFGKYAPLPSFVRAWRATRREYLTHGLGTFPQRLYPYGSAG